MNIEELNSLLPDRYRLEQVPCEFQSKENYVLYLDDNIISPEYMLNYGYTTSIYKGEISTYCLISEINKLLITNLPENIYFCFIDLIHGKLDDKTEYEISEEFSLYGMKRKKNKIMFSYGFSLNLVDNNINSNPIKLVDDFYSMLISKDNIIEDYNNIEEEYKVFGIEYVYEYEAAENTEILEVVIAKITEEILNEYTNFIKYHRNNLFESVFNFPKEYQSILKPYLLYFEEFLNDLCIKTDVNIQVVGEETILSVIPKDKNEALDKIADALKAYLCAPVVSNTISIEESLEMQTTLTKLYAQCKNLESQMMYKDITLKEQNSQIDLKNNIINETKKILVELGVDTNIITQNNTIFLESLKCIKIDGESIEKKPFISSIKGQFKIPLLFKTNFEIKRSK